ncbi:MAG: tRNA 2-thiocytidine(32) synthetase TtcA, partial [Clostridia bacterium]|nr:tRNA 2-thiocytidine(32) synthetase TtcA [Clostridia bacterium]
MDLDKFTGFVRRCVDDYQMIESGDRVAVGVSGGKDSIALLVSLCHLRRFHPSGFEIEAITIDMGFPDMDFAPVSELCGELGVPYSIIRTDIR